MNSPHLWLAIASGGAIGAVARHGVGQLALRWLGPNYPWGTQFVNVVGSFLMGVFIAWLAAREPHSSALRLFVATGVLGAFTTFSTFALDAVSMYRDRTLTIAAVYVATSVALSIFALVIGVVAGRSIG